MGKNLGARLATETRKFRERRVQVQVLSGEADLFNREKEPMER